MTERKKTIEAVMLGHAVGDALGVPVEFFMREELEEEPVTAMRGFGSYPVPAGAWSDDTSMSLAALDSLSGGTVDYDQIMDNFVKWCINDEYTPTGEMFDIGQTCLSAIRRYLASDTAAPWECGLDDEHANGNGSLMRIHPFVLMARYNADVRARWEGVIERASALTHAHRRSVLGCLIYARILLALLEKPEKGSIGEALAKAAEEYADAPEAEAYARLFSPDFPQTGRDEIQGTGYVVHTLEAAVWCVLNTDTYRDCVLEAVNLGDDTDTVAAVAGALAGALYGYEAIPAEWLDTLIRRAYIEELCERAAACW